MKADNLIKVLWDDCLVGTLAMTQDQRVAFQYSDEWLEKEVSISPFSLPVNGRVFVPEKHILMVCLEYLQIVFRMHGEDFYWTGFSGKRERTRKPIRYWTGWLLWEIPE